MRTKSFTLLQALIAFGVFSSMLLYFSSGATAREEGKNQRLFNERAAVTNLKFILNAAVTYKVKYSVYPASLSALVAEGLFSKDELAGCSAPGIDSKPLFGYLFQMTAGKNWTTTSIYVRCRPASAETGTKCFSVDNIGNVVTTNSY